MTAYHIWDGIASIPELSEASGVRMMPSDFFFPQSVDEDHQQLSKMCEIMASGVRGFYRSPALINERRVNPDYPHAVDAYEIMAPIIDTDQAMGWLMNLVKSKGAKFITETINDDLLDIEDKLLARYSADCIINCTGLNGQMTAGDNSVYPIRGALIRVLNDGSKFPKVEAAMTITADAVHDSGEIVFLVPRNDNILLIGGCAELHKTECKCNLRSTNMKSYIDYPLVNLTLDSPIVKKMRHRCEEFLPCLKDAELDASYPLAQGLRPFRQQNVRVERELRKPGSRLVHSYGQGGAGWSLSFGCAEDVAWLVEEVLNDAPARSLQTITEENFREAARTQRYMAANL